MTERPFAPAPVTLEGRLVRLEPLDERHADSLLEFGGDENTARFTTRAPFRTREQVVEYVRGAWKDAIPFAIVERAGGRAVGSTRYFDIRPQDRGLEIGHTWIGTPFQRTGANTECKLLLFRHAFETLGALRVQLRTDLRNLRSQAAIERVGGVREGVLRRHMVMPDGHIRDTVIFAVVAEDWPAVRERLERLLDR